MNQQENTVSVNDTLNALQATEQMLCNETSEVRKHYLHHHLLLNPHATPELSDDAWLINFKRRTERFAEMLEFLERSWAEDIPALQKACFSYLTEDNIPAKNVSRLSRRGQAGLISSLPLTATVVWLPAFSNTTDVCYRRPKVCSMRLCPKSLPNHKPLIRKEVYNGKHRKTPGFNRGYTDRAKERAGI